MKMNKDGIFFRFPHFWKEGEKNFFWRKIKRSAVRYAPGQWPGSNQLTHTSLSWHIVYYISFFCKKKKKYCFSIWKEKSSFAESNKKSLEMESRMICLRIWTPLNSWHGQVGSKIIPNL